MTAEDCFSGRIVRHRLFGTRFMVVNTHEAEGVTWVRVRDASLRIYDMSPGELEADV